MFDVRIQFPWNHPVWLNVQYSDACLKHIFEKNKILYKIGVLIAFVRCYYIFSRPFLFGVSWIHCYIIFPDL